MFGFVLGDKEIRNRMGKDIFIYPYKEPNLKPCSYNMTASKLAYYASNGKLAINKDENIFVPAGETVLIHTNESIYVKRNICATYHSRVTLMARGFSAVSTTLDPEYLGGSLIALTNLSKEDKIIENNESIVTLVFYKVKGCKKKIADNSSNREDLRQPEPYNVNDFFLDFENNKKVKILKEVNKIGKEDWKTDTSELIKKVRSMKQIKVIHRHHIVSFILIGVVGLIFGILRCINIIDTNILITLLIGLATFLGIIFSDIFARIK